MNKGSIAFVFFMVIGLLGCEVTMLEIPRFLAHRIQLKMGILSCLAAALIIVLAMALFTWIFYGANRLTSEFALILAGLFLVVGSVSVATLFRYKKKPPEK